MLNNALSLVVKASILGLASILFFDCRLHNDQPAELTLQVPFAAGIINDPAHHAVFSCLIKNPAPAVAGRPTTMRLYLDSGGDIYPEAEFLPDNPKDIRWPGGMRNGECDLQWYFDRATNQPTRDKLFAKYGVAAPQQPQVGYDYDNIAWDKLRRAMAKQLAGSINTATAHGKKVLVVLIHGYNVADYEHAVATPCGPAKPGRHNPYYDDIQNALITLRPALKDAVWLEVYWDGLQNTPLEIWGAAQASARYAGLGLREVLRQTDTQIPLRFFTHSAGGVVITQALWNNDAFDDQSAGDYEKQLKGMMDSIPTPAHRDVRVGMMVPALTAEAFRFYQQRTPTANQPVYHLVVGQNHKDFAVNKGPVGCHKLGDTCMGVYANSFTTAQAYAGGNQDFQRQDFCVTPDGGRVPAEFLYKIGPLSFETHDWLLYFKRRPLGQPSTAQPIMTAFVHKVLD